MHDEECMDGLRGLQSIFDEPRLVSTDDSAFALAVGDEALKIEQRFDLQAVGVNELSSGASDLTESQSRTGAVVWDASVVMTKYFENKSQDFVVGKRCLELGSGCGLVGMALAVLGAASVLLTDRPEMIPILRRHVDRNSKSLSTCKISCDTLVWGAEEEQARPPFEVIVAADTIYDIDLVAPFISALEAYSDLQTYIFVGFDTSIGRHSAYSLFRELAAAQFMIKVVTPAEREVDVDKEAVSLYLLRRKDRAELQEIDNSLALPAS
jgi:predicted nicotinamide N-methyase